MTRHSPRSYGWIPASAGMTLSKHRIKEHKTKIFGSQLKLNELNSKNLSSIPGKPNKHKPDESKKVTS